MSECCSERSRRRQCGGQYRAVSPKNSLRKSFDMGLSCFCLALLHRSYNCTPAELVLNLVVDLVIIAVLPHRSTTPVFPYHSFSMLFSPCSRLHRCVQTFSFAFDLLHLEHFHRVLLLGVVVEHQHCLVVRHILAFFHHEELLLVVLCRLAGCWLRDHAK